VTPGETFDATEIFRVDLGSVTRTKPTVAALRAVVGIAGEAHDARLLAIRDAAWHAAERHCRHLWRKRTCTVQADIGEGLKFPTAPYWRPCASTITAAAKWDSDSWTFEDVAHASLRIHPGGYTKVPSSGLWKISMSIGESTPPDDVVEAVTRMVAASFMLHVPGGGDDGLPSLAGLLLRSGAGELLMRYR